MKTHRSWLLSPPAGAPERSSYGLGDVTKVSKSELGAFDAEQRQLIHFHFDGREFDRDLLAREFIGGPAGYLLGRDRRRNLGEGERGC